jgi:hypothetical protein
MNRKGAIAIKTVVTAVVTFGAVALVTRSMVSGELGGFLQEGAEKVEKTKA